MPKPLSGVVYVSSIEHLSGSCCGLGIGPAVLQQPNLAPLQNTCPAATALAMLDAVAISDLPEYSETYVKDAEALQSYLQSEVKPGNKHSSKGPAVLKVLKVLSLRRSGCENLPPSSQGDETPCTSNSSSSDGSVTAEEPQLQGQASGDVCSSATDVGAGCSSRKEIAATNDVRSTRVDAAAAITANAASSCTKACPSKQPTGQHAKPQLRLLSFCSRQAQLIYSKLSPAGRRAAAANNSPPKAPRPALYRRASILLPAKGPKATRQGGGSLQPLGLSSRPAATRPQQQRAASLFEATGRENIRYLLGPHAVWGSISR